MDNNEIQSVRVDEKTVLRKFEGEPVPENEFERIHIHNGTVVRVDKIKDGKVVESKEVE